MKMKSLLIGSLLALSSSGFATEYTPDLGHVKFNSTEGASSFLVGVKGYATEINGTVAVLEGNVKSVNLSVPVDSLKTDNAGKTAKMKNVVFKAEDGSFPDVSFKLEKAGECKEIEGGINECEGEGLFAFKNIEKPLKVTYRVVKDDKGELSFAAKGELSLKDYDAQTSGVTNEIKLDINVKLNEKK